MIEELRAPIVDRLVIYLVNKNMVRPDQFESRDDNSVRMSDLAKRIFLSNYEKFMTAPFVDMKTREKKNFRKIIRERVRGIERAILNKSDYAPYVFYS